MLKTAAAVAFGIAIAGPGAPARADRTPAIEGAKPRVQLLSPGAEPRVELRYRPEVGASRIVTTVIDTGVTERMDNATLPESRARVRWTASAEILDVSPEGIASYRFVVRDFELEGADARSAEVAEQRMGSARGRIEEGRIDARGFLVADAPTPAGSDADAPSFAELLVPLPAEAVGPGARWRVVRRVARGGVEMVSTALVTFEKVRSDGILLDVDLDARAPPRRFLPPGAAPGQELVLEELVVAGSAKTLLGLTFPTPYRSNENSNYRMRVGPPPAEPKRSERPEAGGAGSQTLTGSVRREIETNLPKFETAAPEGSETPEGAVVPAVVLPEVDEAP